MNSVSHEFRTIVCGCCGYTKHVPIYCGDRFCPICASSRRTRLRKRLASTIKAIPARRHYRWRFITLTIPNSPDVYEALDALYSSFKKLRQRKFWKQNCAGGFFGAEVTHSGKDWNVHIHIVAFSRFIPQRKLAKVWSEVSPGRIVDIRLLPETSAINYITKYITKQALPEQYQFEASQALRNRRLYSCFGCCHGLKIKPTIVPFLCPQCHQEDWSLLSLVGGDRGYSVDSFVDI